MNILYVITGLSGGGAEKTVADLADEMSNLGHQVKIAYLKGKVIVRPKNKNIELVYIGLESLSSSVNSYLNFRNLILRFKPDVIHANMVHANIFARIARQFISVKKLICTAHSNNEGGKLRMLGYRITHHLADLTTNVSISACKSFEELGAVPKGKINVVYNGIDLNRFKYDPECRKRLKSSLGIDLNRFVFLAVGRLHHAKDYPNLIKAFSLIVNEVVNEQQPILILVGEGEELIRIEEDINKYNLNDYVILLGRRHDVAELMSMADIFVLSSSFEGFGLVVAEAIACETFVVATDCGGVKEVMGGYGLLSLPKNSELLAEQLLIALKMNNEEIIENNKKALIHVQKNFDLKNITQQWLKIYEA